MSSTRVYLSPPHMGGQEEAYVKAAFDSNWLTSAGPNLRAFEASFEARIGKPVVALSSGTAALHLALLQAGVEPGDAVICPSLTFVASANPIIYCGAEPWFVDSEASSWNMSPECFEKAIEDARDAGKKVRAAVVVHLYGQPASMDPITRIADEHGIALIGDAAEALGAEYTGDASTARPAGTLCPRSFFSFNGNKIITTTGGGLYVAPTPDEAERIRYLAAQARLPRVEYHHEEVGFNYRMSNVLAGIGLGQLEVLDARVTRKQAIQEHYANSFSTLEAGGYSITSMPHEQDRTHTDWLSVFEISGGDDAAASQIRDALIAALEVENIESRPVWKPMHMQPLFSRADCTLNGVAERAYRRGICLPSGTAMIDADLTRTIEIFCKTFRTAAGAAR